MKKVTGFKFILFALWAFAGLGIEMLYAFLLEPVIYNVPMQEWTTVQNIIHWIITCITWGIITVVLIKISKQKYQFNLFENKGSMKIWQWISVIVCAVFLIVVSYIDWNGFKVIEEFKYNGWLKFIFQYIYYIFEAMLITLIIVFGQKACELWFKKENFPFGGIIVALTWGLVHILTQGDMVSGLFTTLAGIIFGTVYLLVNKDIKKAFPIICVMLIL